MRELHGRKGGRGRGRRTGGGRGGNGGQEMVRVVRMDEGSGILWGEGVRKGVFEVRNMG